MSKLFNTIGYNPDVIGSGEQALNAIKHKQYDMIFMDINLPGIDGHETTRLIRMSSGYDKTPIIALTASVLVDDKNKCFDAGMNDYIPKPALLETLREKVSYWISWLQDETRSSA